MSPPSRTTEYADAGATAPATARKAAEKPEPDSSRLLPTTGSWTLDLLEMPPEYEEFQKATEAEFPIDSMALCSDCAASIPDDSCDGWSDESSSSSYATDESGESHTGSCRDYLSLICAPKNRGKTDPPGPYQCHPSKGKGSWIAVIDTGCTIDQWPQEFVVGDRSIIRIRMPPEKLHGKHVASMQDRCIFHDSVDDIWRHPSRPRGHGTCVAIIAAGSESGVAPLASLLMYKHHSAVSERIDTESGPVPGRLLVSSMQLGPFIYALKDLGDRIADGRLPKGKTVLNLSVAWSFSCLEHLFRDHRGMTGEFKLLIASILDDLAKQGVTIVVAAGNDNERTVEEMLPGSISSSNSSMIVVGGTDDQGRLWWDSTPGTEHCPVSLYAQAYEVSSYKLGLGRVSYRDGTSLSAPQAGLAAYFLGHPDYQEKFRYSPEDYADDHTVGKRMRDFLTGLAYQRVPPDELLDPDHLDDYNFPAGGTKPSSVDVIYNNHHGDQKSEAK